MPSPTTFVGRCERTPRAYAEPPAMVRALRSPRRAGGHHRAARRGSCSPTRQPLHTTARVAPGCGPGSAGGRATVAHALRLAEARGLDRPCGGRARRARIECVPATAAAPVLNTRRRQSGCLAPPPNDRQGARCRLSARRACPGDEPRRARPRHAARASPATAVSSATRPAQRRARGFPSRDRHGRPPTMPSRRVAAPAAWYEPPGPR